MAASTLYAALTASLLVIPSQASLFARGTSAEGSCRIATATVTEYATARPTTNPHGHGGPYYNPYNDVPLPYTWPGTPAAGETYAPPQPSPPYGYGGPSKDQYDWPGAIPKDHNKVDSSLPAGQQCGNSGWGLIDTPRLPNGGLPASPASSGYPTNSTSSIVPTVTAAPSKCPKMPNTGVTRTYELHVAYQTIAPDGVTRNGLTINGQFPGPLIEANWGDWILFKVTNDLTDEGTTIHAHGLLQKGTPIWDGVPAVGQCPITPNGGSTNMLFRADQYGTSWYHSHYSAQYSGGAHGPMVIYGPKHEEYDIDVGPVMVEDWFHSDYYSLVQGVMNGRFPPSNNNLINGRNNYPCANTTLPCVPNAGVSKFKFQSGKKHLLRLINAGAEGLQKFSLDGHQLKVISVDYTPIEPYTTNVVTLAIGQRTDVIVEGVGSPSDSFWMRSQLGQGERCTLNDGISPNAVAAVYYESADINSVPTSTSSVTPAQLSTCKNDELNTTVPVCVMPLPEPDHTERITFDFRSNGTNFIWYMNNQTYRGDYNNPTLLAARAGAPFHNESNVLSFPGATNLRIHLVNNALVGGHPMHLHGHDFHVLAEGFGEWDGTVVNRQNPAFRDTHQMQNARNVTGTVEPSFLVLQYTQDNPGVWPLHCHLAWHVSGGLFMQFLEQANGIQQLDIGAESARLCSDWASYTAVNPPNQIDSGQ